MRKAMIILTAAMLVMGAFIARDLMVMTSANAAVGGLGYLGLRTDRDFRSAVEWVTERCDAEAVADDRLAFYC